MTATWMIKLDNLDPDWRLATLHAKASMIGYASAKGSTVLCPCCLQVVYKDQVPLCVNSKELQFLGFGFPLFYSFLKNCMILTIILISSYSAVSLKKAIDSNYNFCYPSSTTTQRLLAAGSSAKPTCTSFMIEFSRIENTVTTQQQVLRAASFVVQLLFLIYMRDHITKLESYYDERNTSFADYTVMLKNIPLQKGIQRKLKDFFRECFSNPVEIKQLTLLPEYPQIEQLKQNRNEIIKELRPAYQRSQFSEQDIKHQTNLVKIDQAIQEEVENSHELAQKDELECTKAILVLNTDQIKCEVLQKFDQIEDSVKGSYFGLGAQQITLKQAPQPKQILWKNANIHQEKKLILYLTSWGLSVLLLITITIIFYFIMQQKTLNLLSAIQQLTLDPKNEKYKGVYNGAVALVFIMLFFIIIFNKLIMSTLFFKFTQIQKHQTRSKFQFSFALKYLLGLFFTTALMTLAVEAIRFNNYFSHAYGVIQEESIMFFLNAFFTPLFWLFNPFAIARNIKRRIYFGKRNLTQQEANNIMESSHYDMGKRYAQVIETLWFTFLYSTLIPLGAFISVVGLFLYYWVDKYTLLRKSSLRGEVSAKLVITGMKLLDVTLFLKPAGQLMFDIQVRQATGLVSSIIMLVLGLLYLVLPINKLIGIINPEMFNLEQKTYEQVKQKFKDTYHTEHPIYKMIIAEKLRRKLSKKGHSFDYTNENLNSEYQKDDRIKAQMYGQTTMSKLRESKTFTSPVYFEMKPRPSLNRLFDKNLGNSALSQK